MLSGLPVGTMKALGAQYIGSENAASSQRSGLMNMPAAITSKSPAARPGINESKATCFASTLSMPMAFQIAFCTVGSSPVRSPWSRKA